MQNFVDFTPISAGTYLNFYSKNDILLSVGTGQVSGRQPERRVPLRTGDAGEGRRHIDKNISICHIYILLFKIYMIKYNRNNIGRICLCYEEDFL